MTGPGGTPASVIPVPAPTFVEVQGSQAGFPVRRVYCVGRNYADHAREMGHDPDREPPFFFTKPADAVISCTPGRETPIPYPPLTRELHHEVELAVAIGRSASCVTIDHALEAVWGYGVAIDLTRRDAQAEAKELRRPWDLAKGFDASGPVGPLAPVTQIGHPNSGSIVLHVDGEPRQSGDLSQQIWSVAEIIAHLSAVVDLRPGDLILTGTPSGVGAVQPGARITASIDGVGALDCRITSLHDTLDFPL